MQHAETLAKREEEHCTARGWWRRMASRGALAAGGRGGGVRAAPRWPATAVVTLAPESALPGTWSRTPTHRRRVWTRSRTVGVGAVRWGKERTAARRAWAASCTARWGLHAAASGGRRWWWYHGGQISSREKQKQHKATPTVRCLAERK